MGHFKSNLRDIEFNLFEVLKRQDLLGREPYPEVDEETARGILDEVNRLATGPVAESFIKGAAAHGMTSLKGDLEELAQMEAAHGKEVLLAALERAEAFSRFRAQDVRSIIAAGTGVAHAVVPGEALIVELPLVPTRSLSDYAIGERS